MGRLDEQKAATEADAFLASVAREFGDEYATGEKSYEDLQRANEAGSNSKKKAISQSAQPKNTSVYVTGLTTYIACKQLGTNKGVMSSADGDAAVVLTRGFTAALCAEGMCAKIGKVRRIKFYKNERGGLKVRCLVCFLLN